LNYASGGATLDVPSASGEHVSVLNVDEALGKPAKLSSDLVDPTATYKPDLGSTAGAAARLAIDVLKDSSDAFTPLKSVVGGLSLVLKYYDVWYTHFPNRSPRSLPD
jgi:hypothetical protein